MIDDHEMEKKIIEYFEENYEALRAEGAHALGADVKRQALQQVLCYWRRLKEIARKVTNTEVRLSLPDQKTPAGRTFSIEGVVDIVREGEETWMYDLKTHDADYIRANRELYEDQLNIYAHIWQTLRGNQLNHAAVISTVFPRAVRHALNSEDEKKIVKELGKWEPVVDIPFDEGALARTVNDFGKVVDAIEEKTFAPPPVDVLEKAVPGDDRKFGSRVCRTCDARYSCSSYRRYAKDPKRRETAEFLKYLEAPTDDLEQEEWVDLNLEGLPEELE